MPPREYPKRLSRCQRSVRIVPSLAVRFRYADARPSATDVGSACAELLCIQTIAFTEQKYGIDSSQPPQARGYGERRHGMRATNVIPIPSSSRLSSRTCTPSSPPLSPLWMGVPVPLKCHVFTQEITQSQIQKFRRRTDDVQDLPSPVLSGVRTLQMKLSRTNGGSHLVPKTHWTWLLVCFPTPTILTSLTSF